MVCPTTNPVTLSTVAVVVAFTVVMLKFTAGVAATASVPASGFHQAAQADCRRSEMMPGTDSVAPLATSSVPPPEPITKLRLAVEAGVGAAGVGFRQADRRRSRQRAAAQIHLRRVGPRCVLIGQRRVGHVAECHHTCR